MFIDLDRRNITEERVRQCQSNYNQQYKLKTFATQLAHTLGFGLDQIRLEMVYHNFIWNVENPFDFYTEASENPQLLDQICAAFYKSPDSENVKATKFPDVEGFQAYLANIVTKHFRPQLIEFKQEVRVTSAWTILGVEVVKLALIKARDSANAQLEQLFARRQNEKNMPLQVELQSSPAYQITFACADK